MHPELTVPFAGALRAYPTAIAVACTTGGLWGVWLVRRTSTVSTLRLVVVMAGVVLASLLGARLHYALVHLPALAEQGVLHGVLWGGRMHTAGGLLAFVLVLPVAARALALPPLRLADTVAPAAAFTFGSVRFACLLHGCCFGRPAAWPWCLTYPRGSAPFRYFVEAGLLAPDAASTMPVHPLPLYFVASGLVLAGLAARALRRRHFDGEIALATAVGVSMAMAALEPLRADMPERVYWGPLPQLLWVALAMTVVTTGTLLWAEARHRRTSGRYLGSAGRS
jgi:phosphatidylglycerol---prolipoprotein diacylglyceryl transferase